MKLKDRKDIDFNNLNEKDLLYLMQLEDLDDMFYLYEQANQFRIKQLGSKVFFRGIIEISNICDKDCFYCGIRHSNQKVKRFQMTEDEILSSAEWAYKQNYGSIVMQSGERMDDNFVNYVERLLKGIKKLSNGELGITLSLGEQTKETYKRWFEAGAHRYLLRIESSNKELYEKIHPNDHSFNDRLKCLDYLRDTGYQVGTGVLIGFPGQNPEDLVNDILFFKRESIDMIGMGPYVVHPDTPMGENINDYSKEKQLHKALKMFALTRLYLKDINMASTTALSALDSDGRELGLKAGANIVMPVITDTKYRKEYLLYNDKPGLDQEAMDSKEYLENKVKSAGFSVGYGSWGDSLHFQRRTNG